MAKREFVTMQSRGVLALPPAIRRRHGLDQPGAQVEVIEREDGVIELHPHVAVRSDQAWFWTERWQKMEREVDEQIERGDVRTFDSIEEFSDWLETLEPHE